MGLWAHRTGGTVLSDFLVDARPVEMSQHSGQGCDAGTIIDGSFSCELVLETETDATEC